jgi:hypothetical protein
MRGPLAILQVARRLKPPTPNRHQNHHATLQIPHLSPLSNIDFMDTDTMSFGLSVGDFIAIGSLALRLYVNYHEGPLEFQEVLRELLSLHTTLEELRNDVVNPSSALSRCSSSKQQNLGKLVSHCAEALRELDKIRDKYRKLEERAKKFSWQRVKFGKENIDKVRRRLALHLQGLTLFLATVSQYVAASSDTNETTDPSRHG